MVSLAHWIDQASSPLVIENIKVEETIGQIKQQLEEEKKLSPALYSSLELLLVLVPLLLNRLGFNIKNSRKPPSNNPNQKKDKGEWEQQFRSSVCLAVTPAACVRIELG